jgi:hypothetical protein
VKKKLSLLMLDDQPVMSMTVFSIHSEQVATYSCVARPNPILVIRFYI